MRSPLLAVLSMASVLEVHSTACSHPNVVLICADELCYSENNLCEPHDISPRP